MKKLNTLDLFAGCGGLTDGFKQTKKFDLLGAVEWDKAAAKTLSHRLEKKWGYKDADQRVIRFDMQKTKELLKGYEDDEYGSHKGLLSLVAGSQVDAVIGGPPCQAYSVAGRVRDENGMHDDYRNYLFESYIEVVKNTKPLACVFENVPGILSAAPGGIPIIDRITEAFDKAGYFVVSDLKEVALFSAADFGVPQIRKRVIIVGISKKRFKDFSRIAHRFYEILNTKKVKRLKTVSEAIGDLPKLIPLAKETKSHSHRASTEVPENFDHEPRYHNSRDIGIFKMLAADIQSGEMKYTSIDALKKIYKDISGKDAAIHKYYVLRNDQPSNTIPAHLYKDGLRHIHPDPSQARSITIREAARLQSFADDFEFLGSRGDKYKMIGNAVPPLLGKVVANSLYELFQEEGVI